MQTDWEKYGLRGAVKSVLVEVARFEEAGQLTEKPWSRETLIFNQDGWLTEQTTHNSDGFESRAVSDYSDSHKLLKTRLTSGSFVREVRYIYDGEERLVGEHHITNGKVTTPIAYTYDTGVNFNGLELGCGVWVVDAVHVTRRTITYHT